MPSPLDKSAFDRLSIGKRKRKPAIDPRFAPYVSDPVGLSREFLGLEPWSRQAEALRLIAEHDRVAIRSGHKTGKSEMIAIAALWFACTRAGARVVGTASVYRQVRVVLWRAVKRLVARLPAGVVDVANDLPDHGIIFANGSEIIGFTSDSPEKFAGVSAAELMFLVDEASGVDTETFEAIEGSAAGGARIVMVGNPTRTSGVYFDSFHEKKDFWQTLHISSEETPNVVEGRIVIPGLATSKWVQERKADWGEGSALFAVRVRGEFPRQGTNVVCSLDAVENAQRRWSADLFEQDGGRTTLGVDPSRSANGDDSVIFVVRGYTSLVPIVHRGLDSIALAARVFDAARTHRRTNERALVRVDVGGLGSGVFDQLKLYSEIDVVAVDAGEASSRQGYARRRDELWFGIAEWLKNGGALPTDTKLAGELVAVEYAFTPTGKIKVEGKDELRSRLGRSPDRSDALALACWSRLDAWLVHNEACWASPMDDAVESASSDVEECFSFESSRTDRGLGY